MVIPLGKVQIKDKRTTGRMEFTRKPRSILNLGP